jgi:hypothetical protein
MAGTSMPKKPKSRHSANLSSMLNSLGSMSQSRAFLKRGGVAGALLVCAGCVAGAVEAALPAGAGTALAALRASTAPAPSLKNVRRVDG